jgi:hypothetical protein
MRDNSNRWAPNEEPSEAPVQANVSLHYAAPTEFVSLPSGGRFYPEDHPLHGVGEVEIRYMTAKDEDILASKELLKKGLAIDRFVQGIIVQPRFDIRSLLTGDRLAILVKARSSGLGSEYPVDLKCPSCGNQERHTFDLDDFDSNELDFSDIEVTANGSFVVELPRTKRRFEFRLLCVGDEQESFTKNKKNKGHSGFVENLKRIVVSIDGVQMNVEVIKFIENMPAFDSRFLMKAYAKVNPTLDMTQEYVCSECFHSEEVAVPLTAEFFYPR